MQMRFPWSVSITGVLIGLFCNNAHVSHVTGNLILMFLVNLLSNVRNVLCSD